MKNKLILLSLFFMISCTQKSNHPRIFWVHIEGAPVRTLFDNWADPLIKKAQTKSATFHNQTLHLPTALFDDNGPTALLNNWVNIRGVQTSSPHLKESRQDWLGFLKNSQYPITIHPQNERIHKIYSQLLPQISAHKSDSNIEKLALKKWKLKSERPLTKGMKRILTSWLQSLEHNEQGIDLTILNNTDISPLYFDNLQYWDSDTQSEVHQFYRSLTTLIEVLVDELKQQRKFQNTIIFITSDRQKITDDSLLATTWEGLNISLISGSLKGPFQLGHIYQKHPKYDEAFPGTWGVGTNKWSPRDFQTLVEDLISKNENNHIHNQVNPWFHVNKSHLLAPKLKWGQTF